MLLRRVQGWLLVFVFSFILFFPLFTYAFFENFQADEKVAKDQLVIGDYVKTANIITIEGKVDGDVIVAAQELRIKGFVSGDIIAASQSIIFEGEVDGNIRAVSSKIVINGKVGKNITIFSNHSVLGEKGIVEKNIYTYGGIFDMKGKIGGNLIAKRSQINIGGEVLGDIFMDLSLKDAAVFEASSKVSGSISYYAPTKEHLTIQKEANIFGEIKYKGVYQLGISQRAFMQAYVFGKIVYLFGLLAIGLVLVSLIPKKIIGLYGAMAQNPAKNILRGLLYVVITPFIAVVLLFTIIGIPLAVILALVYIISFYIGKVICGIALGIYIFEKYKKGVILKNFVLPMVAGLFVLVAATNIPIIGWLLNITAILWALGALVDDRWQEIKRWR